MTERRHGGIIAAGLGLALVAATACGSGGTASSAQGTSGAMPRQVSTQQYQGGMATGDTQEGASFAQWVLNQDPRHQYITDAVVTGDQTLGVKVQPTATRADVQRLLVALTQSMAKTFPGKPVQAIAFYQNGQKLAQSAYDPGTGQVSVQFAA